MPVHCAIDVFASAAPSQRQNGVQCKRLEHIPVFSCWWFWSIVFHLTEVISTLRCHHRHTVLFNVPDPRIHVEEQPMIESSSRSVRVVDYERETLGSRWNFVQVNGWNAVL